ncbi:MAG: SGNH/GDSL hydrolase family protein [Solirubrobacterales bacterium]
MRRARLGAGVCAGLLAACAPAATAVAGTSGDGATYAALGDSYTTGPLIPNPKGEPIDCGRSDHNYPTLVANEIAPDEFRDVSCGSAQTEHMAEPQDGLPLGGTNPPQFGALTPGVDLVTVGIGGNDMGFGGIVETCVTLAIQSAGQGSPCTDHYNQGGVDQIAERLETEVAPRVADVIDGIQERSPDARLVVVGFPDPVPQQPGCFPVVPIAPGDLPYLHRVAANLDATERLVAAEGGAEYVELLTGSMGHDICQLPGTKWYEGIVPTAPAFPAHPNALGMEFAAREVLKVLAQPVPNRFRIVRQRASRRWRITLRLEAPYRGSFRAKATATRAPTPRRKRGGGLIRYASGRAFAERPGRLRLRLRTRDDGREALRERESLRVRVKVRFEPVGGEPRTKRTRLRVGRQLPTHRGASGPLGT